MMVKGTFIFVGVSTLVVMCLVITDAASIGDGVFLEMPRVKRATELKNNFSEIKTFVDQVKGLEPADLILIVDRSHALSKKGRWGDEDELE